VGLLDLPPSNFSFGVIDAFHPRTENNRPPNKFLINKSIKRHTSAELEEKSGRDDIFGAILMLRDQDIAEYKDLCRTAGRSNHEVESPINSRSFGQWNLCCFFLDHPLHFGQRRAFRFEPLNFFQRTNGAVQIHEPAVKFLERFFVAPIVSINGHHNLLNRNETNPSTAATGWDSGLSWASRTLVADEVLSAVSPNGCSMIYR
jgi:hypothetical protein